MGLSHPPGWDNISPDVKIGGYSCLKSEKLLSEPGRNRRECILTRNSPLLHILLVTKGLLLLIFKVMSQGHMQTLLLNLVNKANFIDISLMNSPIWHILQPWPCYCY